MGEFFGVFFYCFAGIGATASFVIGELAKVEGLGAIFNIGAAYGLGVVFAISICAMASGGHFNPCITISFALFRGFPWRKVPQYIFFQLLGAFVATLLVYGIYRPTILELDAALRAGGKEALIFTPNGPAGIFAIYPQPGQDLGYVFLNEFIVDFFLALIIWGAIDPSNIFVTPASVPFVIGLAYAVAIWGYAPNTIATNSARDLGARLATTAIWGTRAWGGKYAAIAALTNIPATIFAACVHELFLSDTSRVVTKGARELINNSDAHREHKAYKYTLGRNLGDNELGSSRATDKVVVEHSSI
jgi:MIP family channel proteins